MLEMEGWGRGSCILFSGFGLQNKVDLVWGGGRGGDFCQEG